MEKKRNGIDNFFRENLSDFELSENKGNWDLLNHLLNEQERKKKRRRWFLFTLCFIGILSSGLLVLLPERKLDHNTNDKIELSNPSTLNENSSLKKETPSSNTPIQSNKNGIVSDVSDDVQQIKPENNSSVAAEKNNPFISKMNSIVLNDDAVDISGGEYSEIIKTQFNFNASQSATSLNDSDNTLIETKDPVLFVMDSPENDSLKTNIIIQNTTTPIPPGNDSLLVIVKNNSPADSAIKKELLTHKTNFLNFNFLAGLNIYNTSSEFNNHENISLIAGLEIRHPINSNFSLGLAGLYTLQGGYHLNDTATITQETYFLDKEVNVSQQTIQIRKLHKLYFPLTLYYSLAKKHSILGAIQLSYLLNTRGYFRETNTTSGITTESQKNNVGGYMDGIKSTNLAFAMGYQYSISERFDFNIRAIRELKRAYVKEYFYGVNTNPSWSIQTFLILKF